MKWIELFSRKQFKHESCYNIIDRTIIGFNMNTSLKWIIFSRFVYEYRVLRNSASNIN